MSPGSLQTHIYGIFFVRFSSILEFRVASKKWPALWSRKQCSAKTIKNLSRRFAETNPGNMSSRKQKLTSPKPCGKFAETNNFVHYGNFVKIEHRTLDEFRAKPCDYFHVFWKVIVFRFGWTCYSLFHVIPSIPIIPQEDEEARVLKSANEMMRVKDPCGKFTEERCLKSIQCVDFVFPYFTYRLPSACPCLSDTSLFDTDSPIYPCFRNVWELKQLPLTNASSSWKALRNEKRQGVVCESWCDSGGLKDLLEGPIDTLHENTLESVGTQLQLRRSLFENVQVEFHHKVSCLCELKGANFSSSSQ